MLRDQRPDLYGQVEFFGYFDTPWSLAGQPPFSTVSLDPPAITNQLMAMINSLSEGKSVPERHVTVPPVLVDRNSASIPFQT